MSFSENHRGLCGIFGFGCVVFFISLFSGVGLVKLGPLIQVSLRLDRLCVHYLLEAEQGVAFFQLHVPLLSVAW